MQKKTGALCSMMLIALLMLVSCAATKVVSDWKDSAYTGRNIRKVLVVGGPATPQGRKLFEDELAKQFKSRGIEAVPSYAVLPSEKPDIQALIAKAKAQNIDAVLVARTVGQKTVEPLAYSYPYYAPYAFPYYSPPAPPMGPAYASQGTIRGFEDDYPPGQPYAASPGYASPYQVFSIETNLYDTRAGKLVWSALSDTTTRESIDSEAGSFASAITKKLAKDKLIP